MLFPSLQTKLARYEELEKLLVDPDVLSDTNRMVAFQREYGSLAKVALPVREFNELESNIATARELIDEEEDPELKAYAQDELDTLLGDRESKLTALVDLVATGDAISRGSLIMEIRAGTGGDEAALFARDLFEMYQRLVERRGWKAELIDCSPTELGGFKDITISIAGDGAFLQLQFESGGHRVQRVPETETQGRIHTSAAALSA